MRTGIIRYWNAAATALYGFTKEDMLGGDVTKLMVPPGGQDLSAEIMGKLNNGQSWTGSWFAPRKDGCLIPGRYNGSRALPHDETEHFNLIF